MYSKLNELAFTVVYNNQWRTRHFQKERGVNSGRFTKRYPFLFRKKGRWRFPKSLNIVCHYSCVHSAKKQNKQKERKKRKKEKERRKRGNKSFPTACSCQKVTFFNTHHVPQASFYWDPNMVMLTKWAKPKGCSIHVQDYHPFDLQ